MDRSPAKLGMIAELSADENKCPSTEWSIFEHNFQTSHHSPALACLDIASTNYS
jgi:hypothetical protein